MKIYFRVPGEPQGKGRPRFSVVRGQARARTPDKTILYENLIKTEYGLQGGIRFPDDAALNIWITAYFAVPKSASKKKRQAMLDWNVRPVKKPDADNICKVICDALNGIAYRDDAQIVGAYIEKAYAEEPWVEVILEEVDKC